MNQWWQSLSSRDRLVVLGVSLIASLIIIHTLILTPLHKSQSNARNSVQKQHELYQWMKQRVVYANQLKSSSSHAEADTGLSLSMRMNESASQASIDINRFQSMGDNKLQVWLEKVAFSKLLLWLKVLNESYAVNIENITISETKSAGYVGVRMTIQISI